MYITGELFNLNVTRGLLDQYRIYYIVYGQLLALSQSPTANEFTLLRVSGITLFLVLI